MSEQLAIDFTAARAKREEGIASAADHAGEYWREHAYGYLVDFARKHLCFTGEDVSDAHIAAGHIQPPDLRSWGALYRKAVNEGVIQRIDNNGWSKRRASPCPRYRSLYYMAVAA